MIGEVEPLERVEVATREGDRDTDSLSITKDRWDFSITWNIQRWSGLLAFYCFRESEQINVGNVWIVGSDGSEEEEQEAFVERIESKNEYFETAEFHLVSVEEYLLG
ncbi:hypothetical protein HHK36_030202 [Tetracentron sinense]|uniref:Uncharacterized protein n=1 Tax=Tetracentron sinense TaxID=13715 RepID=A0A835D3A8_TETSI|nr:hypothetical protein HHK36_030202 [Tetracentron sinense]